MGTDARRTPHPMGRIAFALAALLLAIAVVTTVGRGRADAALLRADPEQVLADPHLREVALAKGRAVYLRHCASCHGTAGKGDHATGTPDLTDDDRLYGSGRVGEIEDIVRFGIRADNKRGWNLASMPAYGSAVPYKGEPLPSLNPAQIEDLTQSILWFTGRQTDEAAARRGRTAFQSTAGCWDCHGHDAEGDTAIGAPTLSDDVWLYGGSHDAIFRALEKGRAGYSPAFERALTPVEQRAVAAYTASLAPAPVAVKR